MGIAIAVHSVSIHHRKHSSLNLFECEEFTQPTPSSEKYIKWFDSPNIFFFFKVLLSVLQSFKQGGSLVRGSSMTSPKAIRRVVVYDSGFGYSEQVRSHSIRRRGAASSSASGTSSYIPRDQRSFQSSDPRYYHPHSDQPSTPQYYDSPRHGSSHAASFGSHDYQQSESGSYDTCSRQPDHIPSRSEEPDSKLRFDVSESSSSSAESGFESPPESYRSSHSSYRSRRSNNDGSRRSHASSSTSRRISPPHQAHRSNNSGSRREPHEREDVRQRQEFQVVQYRHHGHGDSGSDAGSDITSITIGPEDYTLSSLPGDSGRRDSSPAHEGRFRERRRRGPNEGPPTSNKYRGVQEKCGMGRTGFGYFAFPNNPEGAQVRYARRMAYHEREAEQRDARRRSERRRDSREWELIG